MVRGVGWHDAAQAGPANDEPLAEWEQELLTSGAGSDGASLATAGAGAESTSNGTTQTAG